jgi:hypothetical protein
MKHKPLIFILIAFLSYSAKSEVINCQANFRDKPNGKIFFSLKDGQNVECMPLQNGWFEISVTISLTEAQYEKNYEIKKGDKVYCYKSKTVLIALEDIPSSATQAYTFGGARGNPKVYQMEIRGYILKSNIKEVSIPENALDIIINKNRADLSSSKLRGFILTHAYEQTDVIKKVYPKFEAYVIEESSVTGGSVTDRIQLLFEDHELILIVHSRPLIITNVKDYDLDNGMKLLVIRPPHNESIKTFIKKYRQAYNGAG